MARISLKSVTRQAAEFATIKMPVTEVTDFPRGNLPKIWQSPEEMGWVVAGKELFASHPGRKRDFRDLRGKIIHFQGESGHKLFDLTVTGRDPRRDLADSSKSGSLTFNGRGSQSLSWTTVMICTSFLIYRGF